MQPVSSAPGQTDSPLRPQRERYPWISDAFTKQSLQPDPPGTRQVQRPRRETNQNINRRPSSLCGVRLEMRIDGVYRYSILCN